MAISRSLMNRQLRANGGIMDVTPRENFGLGSSLKKFVRKIIPNEVAEIATKAAPFVAPFNPALAGVMGGLGTFDQTGSISSGLKSGAMNYGGGQLARYAGGAGFQGNPFGQGGAFTQGGFQGGFSSPLGNQTGLGKLFSNQGTQPIQGIGETTADGFTTGAENFITADAPAVTSQLTKDTILKQPGVFDSITESIKNFDYKGLGNKTLELGKKFGKAMFTNKDGSIDKAAVMGAIAFAGSYAEALALADDAGVELTEGAYDEARKTEKQEEYAGYLTNFFGGKKDGGRIGYGNGANEFMSEQMMLESNPGAAESGSPITIDTTMTGLINKYNTYKKSAPGVSEETRIFLKNDLLKSLEDAGISQEEFMMRLSEDTEMKANGGRIGYALGTPRNTTMFEELNADTIYRPEPDSTITLPNEMPGGDNRMPGDDRRVDKYDDYEFDQDKKTDSIRLLADFYMREEGMSESDAYEKAVGEIYDIQLKEGGRVTRKFGSPEEGEKKGVMEMLAVDVDAGGDDEEDMLMAYTPGFSSQEKSYLFRRMGASGGAERSYTMPQLYRILKNPADYPEDAAVLKEIAVMGLGKKDGGRIGFKDGTDKSMLEKFLDSKLVQEGRYGASEFFFGDPIMFGTPDKFKDGKNNNRGTFKRDSSEYGKLSPEKQAYIEAFLNSEKDNLFLKPGKIKFPTDERMREHNKKITLEDFNEDRNPLELLLGIDYENKAKGGRIGLKDGTGGSNRVSQLLILRDEALSKGEDTSIFDAEIFQLTGKTFKSIGGISEIPTGQPRLNQGGVAERDYRETGGFVPVGIKERADDVPAMLSKNEFVMTADSVRGLGNGSVEEGSKKLYNTMKQAEQKGKIA
jgi:hypothetical protein